MKLQLITKNNFEKDAITLFNYFFKMDIVICFNP